MTIQLRKASFRKWLRGQEPGAVVGHSRRACDCPLTRYLHHLGVSRASVTTCHYWQDGTGDRTARMPRWATWFVWQADNLPQELTAAACLRLLEAQP